MNKHFKTEYIQILKAIELHFNNTSDAQTKLYDHLHTLTIEPHHNKNTLTIISIRNNKVITNIPINRERNLVEIHDIADPNLMSKLENICLS